METFSLIAFITGSTQMIKKLGLPSKYLPLCAVIIGGVVNCIISDNYEAMTVFYGAFVGMSSAGMIAVVDDRIIKAKE